MRWPAILLLLIVSCRPHASSPAFDPTDRSTAKLTQIAGPSPVGPLVESTDRPTYDALDWYARGEDALLRNDAVAAAGYLDKAAAADPDRYEIQLARGTAYAATADVPRAVAAFDLAGRLRQSAIDPPLAAGKLLLANDRADDAVDRFRRAAAGPPADGRSTAAHLWLARALRAAGYARAADDEYALVGRRLTVPTDDLRDDPDIGYIVDHPTEFAAEVNP